MSEKFASGTNQLDKAVEVSFPAFLSTFVGCFLCKLFWCTLLMHFETFLSECVFLSNVSCHTVRYLFNTVTARYYWHRVTSSIDSKNSHRLNCKIGSGMFKEYKWLRHLQMAWSTKILNWKNLSFSYSKYFNVSIVCAKNLSFFKIDTGM